MASVSTLAQPRKTRAQRRAERQSEILSNTAPGFVLKPAYRLWEFAIIAGLSEEKLLENLLFESKILGEDAVRKIMRGPYGEIFLYPSQKIRPHRRSYTTYVVPIETVLAYMNKLEFLPRRAS